MGVCTDITPFTHFVHTIFFFIIFFISHSTAWVGGARQGKSELSWFIQHRKALGQGSRFSVWSAFGTGGVFETNYFLRPRGPRGRCCVFCKVSKASGMRRCLSTAFNWPNVFSSLIKGGASCRDSVHTYNNSTTTNKIDGRSSMTSIQIPKTESIAL